ncbi:MAG: 50S ribosomal protein L21 [Oligoflexia bacterium]|nr:50S ribosomal protein L21 [Oligoflexia bacterium]
MPKATKSPSEGQSKDFAIVRAGGAQHKVTKGLKLSLNVTDLKAGEKLTLSEVLLVSVDGKTSVGAPLVSGASVTAKILGDSKGDKVIIYKKKRRTGYTKKQGHRQKYTDVLVESINA